MLTDSRFVCRSSQMWDWLSLSIGQWHVESKQVRFCNFILNSYFLFNSIIDTFYITTYPRGCKGPPSKGPYTTINSHFLGSRDRVDEWYEGGVRGIKYIFIKWGCMGDWIKLIIEGKSHSLVTNS